VMRIASMPMYDILEVRKALDDYWAGLRRHLLREGISDLPETLEHGRHLRDLWGDPKLIFSQCCGYDIVKGYAGKLRPVATPHYGAPGCKGYKYASVIVVSEKVEADDVLEMRGAVCVINGPESHSGMSSIRALVAPVSNGGRFFSLVKTSGAHANSLKMLRRGEADVAAIDCVTYAILEAYRPDALSGCRRLGRTYRAPGIPYVTLRSEDSDNVARMRTAIFRSFADPALATARHALFLKDIEALAPDAYDEIRAFESFADKHDYSLLQ
jgi:ABC-type phosphate/phosphonate transport system substrate-binding protein